MTKTCTTIFALMLSAGVYAQSMQEQLPKLSPVTRMLLMDMEKAAPSQQLPEGYIYREQGGTQYLTGMIKVRDLAGTEAKLEQMGVLIGTKAGDIWTVSVPYNKIKAFTQTTGINYIQLDRPLKPALEKARQTTRTDSVHQATEGLWPFTGEGIIMGVIDFGFDYGHPSFFDTLGTNYRVSKVWELNTTGTPPGGYTYGHEVTGASAIQAQGTDNNEQTHGTGVAGIAAGSGYGSNGKHRGIAFNSEMVFVGVRRDSIGDQWMQSSFSDFVDGVDYIFDHATAQNKPAVVNISWGSQSGPHDGTSLFNQACDNLSGSGKIIVMSAGNDGQEKIHLSKTFTATDTLISSFATFSADAYKRTWIDVWGDTGKTFCARVTLYKDGIAGNTTDFICIDDQVHSTYLLGDNGLDTCYVDFLTSSSEFNNKPRMTLNIFNKAGDSVHISVKGFDGAIDIWNESYYYGYKYGYSSIFESLGLPGAVDGNTESTVSDMGSAKSVLLVGAYTSKRTFRDLKNNLWSYSAIVGDIASFSSRGPMADGRISPNITAPGITLATATSSFDLRYVPTGLNEQQLVSTYNFNGKDYYYGEFTGTSASSPVAAGIVALMLQANPSLNPQQVEQILAQTAITDRYTGTLSADGDNTWGHGKINAFAAVKAALATNSIYEFNGLSLDCALFPNPNNGVFTLNLNGRKNELLKLNIYNAAGRVILSDNWQVTEGRNMKPIDISSLPAGMYLVHLASDDGGVSIKTFKN